MPIFTRTDETDRSAPKGVRKVLRCPEFPRGSLSPLCADDRLAVCAYVGPRTWEARFWVGYDSVKAVGSSMAVAMRRLEAELDRQSIGLFGADAIAFAQAV